MFVLQLRTLFWGVSRFEKAKWKRIETRRSLYARPTDIQKDLFDLRNRIDIEQG
jgi:hypothetical protein